MALEELVRETIETSVALHREAQRRKVLLTQGECLMPAAMLVIFRATLKAEFDAVMSEDEGGSDFPAPDAASLH